MAILRSDIETQITNYLNRTDLATFIADWFITAHEDLQRLHNFKTMEATIEDTLITDQSTYLVPDDIKEPILVYSWDPATTPPGVIEFYEIKDIADVRERRFLKSVDDPSVSDLDEFICAFWGERLELYPAVDSTLNNKKIRVDYFRIRAVPGTGQSNWFTNHAFDYLRYRALMESAPFLGSDERLVLWERLMTQAYSRITSSDVPFKVAGPLVMRG